MSQNLVIELGTALLAGLLGSIHCAAMCGPLAALSCRASLASLGPKSWQQKITPYLFVSGKFIAYSVLGLLAGSLGSSVAKNFESSHAIAIISICTATFVIAAVIFARVQPQLLGKPITKVVSLITKLSLSMGWKSPLLIGATASLIPCGLLYAMVIRSSASAAPLESMLVMQAFGLGTSPVLIGLGSITAWLPKRFTKYGSTAGEVVLVLSALTLIWRGIIGLQTDPIAACCSPP